MFVEEVGEDLSSPAPIPIPPYTQSSPSSSFSSLEVEVDAFPRPPIELPGDGGGGAAGGTIRSSRTDPILELLRTGTGPSSSDGIRSTDPLGRIQDEDEDEENPPSLDSDSVLFVDGFGDPWTNDGGGAARRIAYTVVLGLLGGWLLRWGAPPLFARLLLRPFAAPPSRATTHASEEDDGNSGPALRRPPSVWPGFVLVRGEDEVDVLAAVSCGDHLGVGGGGSMCPSSPSAAAPMFWYQKVQYELKVIGPAHADDALGGGGRD